MKRGLTLIELVLTIGLMGVLGIAMGLLLGEQLQATVMAHDSTLAMQLARAELERLDALNNFFAPELAVGTTTTPNYAGSPYTLTRAVSCLAGNCRSQRLASQGLKQIRVSVSPAGSKAILAALVTYRAKDVSFGS